MGAIRDAASRPLVVATDLDLTRRGFDPSILHYWSQVGSNGEWPTMVVAPACTPSIRRTVPRDVADGPLPDPSEYTTCAVCTEVASAYATRQCQRGVHHSTTVDHECRGA
jgi:hypothetical protein